MKTIKDIGSFILSSIIIAVSVLILILVSLVSMLFNGVLFVLMISGLSIPIFGNMLVNKITGNKS